MAYSADQVNWTEIAASKTSVSVTGLTYGTQVSFKVKALGDGFIGPVDRNFLSLNWMKSVTSTSLMYPEAKADAVSNEEEELLRVKIAEIGEI